jgi:RNA polymerase sigma factor (sigma-70 family)
MDDAIPSRAEPLPFDQVYERYIERVFRFCFLQVGNRALAEDLAEDTFMAAYHSYERTKPDPDRVHVWLFRIARNLISNHRRQEKARSLVLQIVGRQSLEAKQDVEHVAETNAELARVIEVLSQMKPRDRRVVGLRVAAKLSNREIADVLNVSENTAATIVRRAIERFHRLSESMP